MPLPELQRRPLPLCGILTLQPHSRLPALISHRSSLFQIHRTSPLPLLCPAEITSPQLQTQTLLIHPNSFINSVKFIEPFLFPERSDLPDSPWPSELPSSGTSTN